MTDPPSPAPVQLTPLSDPENVGWVDTTKELTEEQAYWRLRGMIPPPDLPLEE